MSKIAKEYLKVFNFVETMSAAEQAYFERGKQAQNYFLVYQHIKKLALKPKNKENKAKYELLAQKFAAQDFRHLLRNLWKKLLENADTFYAENPLKPQEANCAKLLQRAEYLLAKNFGEEAFATLKKARTLAVEYNLYTQFAKIQELSEVMWTKKIFSPLENQDWYQTFIEASIFALERFEQEKGRKESNFKDFLKLATNKEFQKNWQEEEKIKDFRYITYALKQAYSEELPNRDVLAKQEKMNFYEIYFAQYIRQKDKANLLRIFDDFLQEAYDFLVQKDQFFSTELMYWQSYIFWFSQKEGHIHLSQKAYRNLKELWESNMFQTQNQHTAYALFWQSELQEMKEVLLWENQALSLEEKIEALKKISPVDFENFEKELIDKEVLNSIIQKLKLYFLQASGVEREKSIQNFETLWTKLWQNEFLDIPVAIEADLTLMKAMLMLLRQEDLDSILRRLDYLLREKRAGTPFRKAMKKYLATSDKLGKLARLEQDNLAKTSENTLQKALYQFSIALS